MINILRVLIKHPNSTTPLEECSEGDICVVASPARIQQFRPSIVPVYISHVHVNSCNNTRTWFFGKELPENEKEVLRIKLKCGLVCELTLRVNRHSNSQESPFYHHYVF